MSRFTVTEAGYNRDDDKYNTLHLTMEPTSTDYQNLAEQIPSPNNMTIECFQIYNRHMEDDDIFYEPSPDCESREETIQLLSLLEKICNKFDSIKIIEIDCGSIPLVTLSTILIEAKKLEELKIKNINLVTSSISMLDSLRQISNKAVKRCYIDTVWVKAFNIEKDDMTNDFPSTKLSNCLLSACPNLEDLKVEDHNYDFEEYDENTDWNNFFPGGGGRHLKKLVLDVGTSFSAFLTTLANLQPSYSLREVEIFGDQDETGCDALEAFLSQNQRDDHPVTKLVIFFGCNLCSDDEEPIDFSLIAKALRYNRRLTTFQFKTKNVRSRRFFNDEYAEALAASILQNPRLTCVESTYQNENSDHVKNIEMYLAVNRHKALVLEEGNTAATKLLWIHMLGLYVDNLSYLYHLLQQNPSLCNLNNPKRSRSSGKRRKLCSISSPASEQQPSNDCSGRPYKK